MTGLAGLLAPLILFGFGQAAGEAAAAPVGAVAFSPDGSALAVAAGRTVAVRSPRDASLIRLLPAGLARATALAFHPRADLLAAAGGVPGESGAVAVLDWKRGEVAVRMEGQDDLATAVAFSPDGSLLVVASADGSATVHRLKDGGRAAEEAFRLPGHAGAVLAAGFSPDGLLVVTAGADRSVKVWSAAGCALLRSMNQHGEAVQALAFRPAAHSGERAAITCATGSDDRTARVWQPETGRMVRIVRRHQGAVLAVVYAADGRSLFTAGAEGIIRQIDAESDRVLGQWTAGQDWIYALSLSPDGKRLAAGDGSGTVKLWEVAGDGLRPAAVEEKK